MNRDTSTPTTHDRVDAKQRKAKRTLQAKRHVAAEAVRQALADLIPLLNTAHALGLSVNFAIPKVDGEGYQLTSLTITETLFY